jgi:hypothetical protein
MAYLHIVHFYAHVYIGVCFLFGYDLKKLIDFLSLTTYNKETGDSRLKLNRWFEIDEMEYIGYRLKGYTITADEKWVWWYLDGQKHRTDGPAVIWPDGTQAWWLNDQRHRTDGPALIWPDGTQAWYLNGQRHRTDGPAVIHSDGTRCWWLNGQLHRTNGPAVISASGAQHWYLNGQKHRTDGPAVIWADGTQHWYLNDRLCTEAEWRQQVEAKQLV